MRRRRLQGLTVAAIALIMVATAALAAWLVVSSGVLAPPADASARPVAQGTAPAQALQRDEAVAVNRAFQLSQPRDPFRPLITEDSPPGGIPGVGGTPGSGDTGNGGFQPGNTISLEEIKEVNGEQVAVIVVNGVTYEVREGETFAGSFKVIEINDDSVLLQYGDIVFELKVGQQILK